MIIFNRYEFLKYTVYCISIFQEIWWTCQDVEVLFRKSVNCNNFLCKRPRLDQMAILYNASWQYCIMLVLVNNNFYIWLLAFSKIAKESLISRFAELSINVLLIAFVEFTYTTIKNYILNIVCQWIFCKCLILLTLFQLMLPCYKTFPS